MNNNNGFALNENYAGPSHIDPRRGQNPSGLTLVIPSLKSLKAAKKKGQDVEPKPKIPRPVKLKPLKEVLTKLIGQIKKKDDYAFFLSPVDVPNVPGYADVVQHPMDLGTMSTKVSKGKYRSLEEFAADLRLVTSNAKAFNPPGTIYHTEADRIESYALDHIQKAAPTVIEYETDWNIDVEKDEEKPLNVDDDDATAATPMDVDGEPRGRSPSTSSTQYPAQKRGPRGPYKKGGNTISESIDAEGRLPGSKDGLGVFPPGSDWAQLMLALKLKGKRYRTKKERMRMEKGGPPYAADGSIDYPEMEDPFSILSVFAPEPASRPQLRPLYPPQLSSDQSSPSPTLPGPSCIPLKRPAPTLSTLDNQGPDQQRKKRRHWHIVRNATTRGKGKDKDEEEPSTDWRTPREAHTVDFGSYAALAPRLAEEMHVRDVGSVLGSEERVFEAIRSSVAPISTDPPETQPPQGDYWTLQRALEAEDYIRDIVYGGVDGLAYVRSLAEFMKYPKTSLDTPALGVPLVQWVEDHFVDALTDGRHRLLRETAKHLLGVDHATDPFIESQTTLSRETYPSASHQLSQLIQITTHQIDMAALIHDPNELFVSEAEWVGATYKRQLEEEKEKMIANNAAEYLAFAIQTHKEAESQSNGDGVHEGPEVLEHVLNYAADRIIELDRKRAEGVKTEGGGDGDDHAKEEEDPVLRQLRLNLLALAKRAPLDKIARLPADLVPAHIRHFVPTLAP